jgi:hypothetical protein
LVQIIEEKFCKHQYSTIPPNIPPLSSFFGLLSFFGSGFPKRLSLEVEIEGTTVLWTVKEATRAIHIKKQIIIEFIVIRW